MSILDDRCTTRLAPHTTGQQRQAMRAQLERDNARRLAHQHDQADITFALSVDAIATIAQLRRDLAAERAARTQAEARLLERAQGGPRYARHT